ncbi:hypothetical protein NQD34_013930 [Periophthalmus magnuspinnatus]|nr:hypothetical protein NQD34_013930 [Periophthalmus magnuspinnatus]
MTVYVMTNKQKQARARDNKKKLVNEWINDDFEWTKPNGVTSSDYRNPSFTPEVGHHNPMYHPGTPPQWNGLSRGDMWLSDRPAANGAIGRRNRANLPLVHL